MDHETLNFLTRYAVCGLSFELVTVTLKIFHPLRIYPLLALYKTLNFSTCHVLRDSKFFGPSHVTWLKFSTHHVRLFDLSRIMWLENCFTIIAWHDLNTNRCREINKICNFFTYCYWCFFFEIEVFTSLLRHLCNALKVLQLLQRAILCINCIFHVLLSLILFKAKCHFEVSSLSNRHSFLAHL